MSDARSLRALLLDLLDGQPLTKRSLAYLGYSPCPTGDTSEKANVYLLSRERGLTRDATTLLIMVFPVDEHDRGLLLLKSDQRHSFPAALVEAMAGVAQILGVAMATYRAQGKLRERVKELSCLYGVSRVNERPADALPERLQGIVELLPPAWQYPELTSARMMIDGREYRSSGWQPGPWRQRAEVVANAQTRGFVEVVYATKMLEADEGPFLAEERSLIDSVARQVALIIERWEADDEKEKLLEQVRHADRLATIGELAAVVAHELNEPLLSILGFARLAQKSLSTPERSRDDLAMIVTASLHAREIIKKLTTFARRAPSSRTSVDLSRVVNDSLFLLESRCVREKITLKTMLAAGLPALTADSAQLQQVLVNLAVNAMQAMPSGGKLTIRTAQCNSHVSLIVEDTGTGMSDDVKAQVFLPFFTTKEAGKGTGLGLAVVHGIVAAHGGSVEVESQPGRGSRFSVSFPLTKRAGLRKRH